MSEVTNQPPVTEKKVPGKIASALSVLWNTVEEVDKKINTLVAKISDGHSTLFVAAIAVGYWFLRPFVGIIFSIPAKVTEILLQVLAVAVPAVINAIPYMILVAIGLLLIVELVNLLKKKPQ